MDAGIAVNDTISHAVKLLSGHGGDLHFYLVAESGFRKLADLHQIEDHGFRAYGPCIKICQ